MEFLSFARQLIVEKLDDDFIDRLNYYYTPSLLLMFGLLLSAQQWVGQPIECWVPPQFNSAWEEYTENYCFVQNTWFIEEYVAALPRIHDERDRRQLGWYQWTPFILGLMAFLFHTPYAIWGTLNWITGLNINGICKEAQGYSEKSPEDQVKHVEDLTSYIRLTLKAHKQASERSGSSFVTLLYLVIKALFFLTALGQLLFMNFVFSSGRSGIDHSYWLIDDLIIGRNWEVSGTFPRVTMCDFEVRVMGNLQRHTVQCVLLINIFNEKIFLFLWWWILALIFLNLGNFVYWIANFISTTERIGFVRKFLGEFVTDDQSHWEQKTQRRFTLRYLRQDGILVCRKLAYHCGNILAARVVRSLYDSYRDEALVAKREKYLSPNSESPYPIAGSPVTPIADHSSSYIVKKSSDNGWKVYHEGDTKTIDDTYSQSSKTSASEETRRKRNKFSFFKSKRQRDY